MFEYQRIIHRLRQGQTIRAIAKQGLASRDKIAQIKQIAGQQGWLDAAITLPDEALLNQIFQSNPSKTATVSAALPFKPQIQDWLERGITARRIHEHLVESHSFTGSYSSVQRLVQRIKSTQVELTTPLYFPPGLAAQVDFGAGPPLWDERVQQAVKTWVFVMTLCWSRHQYAELITHQDVETWLRCHQNAFVWFNGLTQQIIIDNAKCAITKACYYDPQVQRSYEAFARDYGFVISACPPAEPQKKGRVESGVKFLKRSFFPLRTFRSLQDANQQLKDWILGRAGNRCHGSVFEKPLNRFTENEQAQLKSLPAALPEIALWQQVRLYKDCHIRFQQGRYSVPHTLYGQPLWLKATQTQVAIYHEHQLVALHARGFKPGDFSTHPEHLPKRISRYLERNAQWCLEQSLAVGAHCRLIAENLLTDPVRNLLHQAQGLLNLRDSYGDTRLEMACKRAVFFQAMNLKTVRTILKSGLDYQPLSDQDAFQRLSSVYTGCAIYQRTASELLH